eukprot:15575004-Heterocapsa_arctica.AAC.1
MAYLWDRFLLWVHLFCVTNCVTQHCLARCEELEKYMRDTGRHDEIAPDSVMLFANNVEAPPTFSKVVENMSVTRQGLPSPQGDL